MVDFVLTCTDLSLCFFSYFFLLIFFLPGDEAARNVQAHQFPTASWSSEKARFSAGRGETAGKDHQLFAATAAVPGGGHQAHILSSATRTSGVPVDFKTVIHHGCNRGLFLLRSRKAERTAGKDHPGQLHAQRTQRSTSKRLFCTRKSKFPFDAR